MGYYVNGNGHLVIKKENLAAAYEALMALNDAPDDAKHGGSYSGGGVGKTASWFSWMPADLRELADTKAVFEALGFETMDSDGDLVITCYDNKSGQEEVFFAAAAPFIENGSYEWTGEDSAFWEWEFIDGKMYQRDGVRGYGEAFEVSVPELNRQQIEMVRRIEASFGSK
jgi:hypothetical protein